MECDRCHFENYDEAYSCRRCGAKLKKHKNSGFDDFTSQFKDNGYDNYNRQQGNFNYHNSYNQQQGGNGYQNNYNQPQDSYNYQNNYNQTQSEYNNQSNYNQYQNNYNSQNNYNQTQGNYNNQSNYSQQTNYTQQNSFNGNNQNSRFNSIYNDPDFIEQIKDIPDDGKIHRLKEDKKTEYHDNCVVHTKTTTFVTRKKVSPHSANSFGKNNQDSELHRMYEAMKRNADYQQQYNPSYGSDNNSYNNFSYNPDFNSYNNKINKSNNKLIQLLVVIAIMLIAFIILPFILVETFDSSTPFIEQPTEKATVTSSELDSFSLKPSDDKCIIFDSTDSDLSVDFSIPEGYSSNMHVRKDNVMVSRYDRDINAEDPIAEASVSIIEDNTELNLSFYKNFYEDSGLQIISEETTETSIGTMHYITTLVNGDEFYLGFIDLGHSRCLSISTSHLADCPEYNYEAKELMLLIAHTATKTDNRSFTP